MNSILRWIGVAIAVGLLAGVCSGHEHSGHKGSAVPLYNVVSSIVFSAIATLLVRILFNTTAGRISAPFVGGIAGVFGNSSKDLIGKLSGPYGGVIGLLVGLIIILIPAPHVRRIEPDTSNTKANPQNENER